MKDLRGTYEQWVKNHVDYCSQSDEWLFRFLMAQYYVDYKDTSHFVRWMRENKPRLYSRWEKVLLLR
jgi:hypothetical protein